MNLTRTVLALLVLAPSASAQAPTITVQDVILHLGMTQQEAFAAVAHHTGLYLNKDGSITNQPYGEDNSVKDMDHFTLYASLKFTQGKLSYVEKFWRNLGSPDTALVIMTALYGATTSVAGSGRICTVRTLTTTEPEEEYKETSIECAVPGARRSVHAFVKTFHYQRDLHSIQVNEVLEAR